MEKDFYFRNTEMAWVKFTEYEYSQDENGNKIIIAGKGAKPVSYDVFIVIIDMLIDILRLGKNVFESKATASLDGTLDFVRKYGTFGHGGNITQISGPTEIMAEAKKLYNVFLRLNRDLEITQVRKEKGNQVFFPLESHELLNTGGLRFTMETVDYKSVIKINCDNLFDFICYAFITIMNEEAPRLHACKHCGGVFFAENAKMAFDTPQCRNQYNVYRHREKYGR